MYRIYNLLLRTSVHLRFMSSFSQSSRSKAMQRNTDTDQELPFMFTSNIKCEHKVIFDPFL